MLRKTATLTFGLFFLSVLPSSSLVRPGDMFNVVGVDTCGISTRLFCEIQFPSDTSVMANPRFFISDKSTFKSSDGRSYKLISALNMPLASRPEPRAFLFEQPGQKHRFILEFEPLRNLNTCYALEGNIPGFDCLNTKIDIRLDSSPHRLDAMEYIKDYPITAYGLYYDHGAVIKYLQDKDFTVAVNFDFSFKYGRYVVVNTAITNNTQEAVLYEPLKFVSYVETYDKLKKKKARDAAYLDFYPTGYPYDDIYDFDECTKDYDINDYNLAWPKPLASQVMTYDEFDTEVQKNMNKSNFWAQLAEVLTSGLSNVSYSSSTSIGPQGVTSTSTQTYDARARRAQLEARENRWREIEKEQNGYRAQQSDSYLKMSTIYPGETLSGFFYIKVDNLPSKPSQPVRGHVDIVIEGRTYTFNFNN